MKTVSTLNGMASMTVGNIATRATNHVCRMNSRQAHGGRNICTKMSSDIAKKLPSARTGLTAESAVTTSGPFHAWSGFA